MTLGEYFDAVISTARSVREITIARIVAWIWLEVLIKDRALSSVILNSGKVNTINEAAANADIKRAL